MYGLVEYMSRAFRGVVPEFGGKTEVNRETFVHSVAPPNRVVATDIQTVDSLGSVSAKFESRWGRVVFLFTQTFGESGVLPCSYSMCTGVIPLGENRGA